MKWPEVPIRAFCSTSSGGTPLREQYDRFYGGTIPWVKSGELRETIISSTEERITEDALNESSAKIVPAGAILVAMYGATVGRVGILGIEAATNQAICSIVPDQNKAEPRFIFHCLQAKLPSFLASRVGGAQPNISQEIIRSTKISLPPIDEQRRIAAILDQAEALRTKRRQALAKLDTLTQSLFLEMFGDPGTRATPWPIGTVDDVVHAPKGDVRCGPFGTQLKVAEIRASGVPLFGIETAVNNAFNPEVKKFVSAEKAKELKAFSAIPGDVLVTRMGTIGRSCVVPNGFGEARFSYHLFRIRPDRTKCLPEFLASIISRSGLFLRQLRDMAHGAIMDGLSTENLRTVRFTIPPLTFQVEFLKRLAVIENLRADMNRDSLLNKVFASLQHQAFRGEL